MSIKAKEKMQVSYLHKIIERLLIFTVISSFIFCVMSFLHDIAVANQKDIIALYTFLAVLLTQLISFIIISIYFNEKSQTANFIRFIVFYLIGLGVILFFTSRWISFPIVFIATAVQTFLYFKIYEPFFEHDCFERQCIAKNNTSLQKELYDYNMHLSQSASGYRQNRTIFVILGTILSLLAGICISTDSSISVLSICLLITFLICAGAHFFLYAYYVREASYASNGFQNVFDFRLRTILTSIFIFAFCFCFGILISSNHSPLKLSYLLYFFRLFKPKDIQNPQLNAEIELDDYSKRLRDIQALQEAVSDRDTKGTDFFAIACGLFFVTAIAWFFLKPFITRRFSVVLRGVSLKQIFLKFFTNLKKYIKQLFNLRINKSLKNTDNARRFMNEMEDLLKKSKKSKEKQAELDRLSRVFVKLIDWGEEHDIHYTKNLAPAEYTALFKNKNADIAGFLFEQALYAKEPLSKEQEDDFNKSVKAVICA